MSTPTTVHRVALAACALGILPLFVERCKMMFGLISPTATTYITHLDFVDSDSTVLQNQRIQLDSSLPLGINLKLQAQDLNVSLPIAYPIQEQAQEPKAATAYNQRQGQDQYQAQEQDPSLPNHLVSSTFAASTRADASALANPKDDNNMFAAMRSAFNGGNHGGSSALMQVQLELQQLKAAPILNPHFGMVTK